MGGKRKNRVKQKKMISWEQLKVRECEVPSASLLFFSLFSYVCPTQLEDVKKLFWILKYFTSEFTRMCLVRSPGQGGKFSIHQLHVNISSLRVQRSSPLSSSSIFVV